MCRWRGGKGRSPIAGGRPRRSNNVFFCLEACSARRLSRGVIVPKRFPRHSWKVHGGGDGAGDQQNVQRRAAQILKRQIAAPEQKHRAGATQYSTRIANGRFQERQRGLRVSEPFEVHARGPTGKPGQARVQSSPVRKNCRQLRDSIPKALHVEMKAKIQTENHHGAEEIEGNERQSGLQRRKAAGPTNSSPAENPAS